MKYLMTAALGALCCLSCKPLINSMVFHPDQETYIPPHQLPPTVSERFITTEDNVRLQCYFVTDSTSDRILIYFHGNAGNICHRLDDFMKLNSFGVNVLGVSYRGYGRSQGTSSEAGIYKDGKAALKYAVKELGFGMDRVIVLGRSIGSTVAVNTARNTAIDRLILVTPLTSAKEIAPATGIPMAASLAGNAFDNLNKIKEITCPLLIIHGTNDQVIPYKMGQNLYAAAPEPKRFVTIEGAGHNDISSSYSSLYFKALQAYLAE